METFPTKYLAYSIAEFARRRQFHLMTGNVQCPIYFLRALRLWFRNRPRRNLCRRTNTSSHAEAPEQDADESIQNHPGPWISASIALCQSERGLWNWW